MSFFTRSSGHGMLWWICHLLAWAATLALIGVMTLRVFYYDGSVFLTWLNAFTRYVYLPAYACLVWAAWQRRWGLAIASSVVVCGHVILMAPDFVRDRRFALSSARVAEASATPPVRVFFSNVLQGNREYDRMLKEMAAADPDVIVVAEWGWGWHKAFKQSALSAVYGHGTSMAKPQFGMLNIFSKVPLKNEMQNWVAGRLVHTADIPCGAGTLRLIGLHAPRPLYEPVFQYGAFWDQMIALLTTESGPLLVIGDFNATEHSRVYQELKETGLRSAHDDRGRGYAVTWPNGSNWLPPIRIDQAFISAEVECERIAEGDGKGSDHKPLIVDLRIRGGEGTGGSPAGGAHVKPVR